MAPSAVSHETSKPALDSTGPGLPAAGAPIRSKAVPSSSASHIPLPRAPLKTTGVLDAYESFDVTPVIGREFPTANVVEWLRAPNADELLRDLAITISERGVVFFRAQDDLTNDLQKKLVLRLGALTGRPATSSLHIHPWVTLDLPGGDDPEISTITTARFAPFDGKAPETGEGVCLKSQNNAQWHADTTFEPVPADYTSLRLTQLPKGGGDTMWASGYEVYDRISPAYQKFLEGLTATFRADNIRETAARHGLAPYAQARGAPENVGTALRAVHPVVRTNPVTAWKSIFPVGGFARHVNGLGRDESDHLLKWFMDLIYRNHDLQVRQRWKNKNDLAIWDNRSVYHTMTLDYHGLGERFGYRAVGIGEAPYFDPNSTSRREDLGLPYIQ